MANSNTSEVIQHLCSAVLLDRAGMTDGQLLDCFLTLRDAAALAALVRRHVPMVWGVCRRILHNYHDAEDAFQATFLVLVRKAAVVEPREMVANWLHGVAYQTALKARSAAARRKERERQVVEMPDPAALEQDVWLDLQPLLDQELSRLPDKYRVPIVLCDLEGKTRKEVARQLGWPEGTVAGRLATARKMLAKRLAQRGLVMSGGALAAVLSQNAAQACVPATVVASTIRAATLAAVGNAATVGVISAQVAALTQGVLKTMLLQKLKVAMAVLLVLSATCVGAGGLIYHVQAGEPAKAGELQIPCVREDEKHKVKAKHQKQEETKSVWKLNFRFKNLRFVTLDDQNQHQGRKTVCYCWYQVSNPTDESHTFTPDFELVAGDKVYHDTVLPGVQEAVRRIEDPDQSLDMKNSVTVANKPIPPSKQAADENKSVVGVAFWEGVDQDARNMTLFVTGLSNDWSSDDGDTIRRKTLKLSFKRVDNEMRHIEPAQWIYRITKLHEEDNENDQQAEIERKSWTKDWRVVQIDGKGAMAYINLGSSDGITPKVKFSIRSMSLDSKRNPAKGTLEVVRVIGPHLSQAQVTSVKNPLTDPILKGDQLFNPTRDSNRAIEEMPEKAKDKEAEEAKSVIEGLIKQLEDRKAILEQELLDWERKRERLRVQIWLIEDEIQKASADNHADLRANSRNKKAKHERLLATYEWELTARHFALELQKKRSKALQQLLLE
jgi:RNA polymerase sigma factor (sigma-70 family)